MTQDQESENSRNSVTLAVSFRNKRFGCAFLQNDKLFLMSDLDEAVPFDILKLVLLQINPSLVIVSNKSEEVFLEAISENVSEIKISSSSEFILSNSRNILFSLKLESLKNLDTFDIAKQMAIHIESIVPLDNSNEMISSAGALILHLRSTRMVRNDGEFDDGIANILSFSLDNIMLINSDALWYCTLILAHSVFLKTSRMQTCTSNQLNKAPLYSD